MKIFFFILIFFFNFTNLNADIVYIDINLILNKSEVGKSLNTYLKNINDEHLNKHSEIEARLVKIDKELVAQQNIINSDEYEKRLEKLSNDVQNYQLEKKKDQDYLKKIKINNTKKILEFLNPIITNYVETNSISLVMPKKNIIVGKKNLDITDEIIKLLNDRVKSLRFLIWEIYFLKKK